MSDEPLKLKILPILNDLFPLPTQREVENKAWSISPGSFTLHQSTLNDARQRLEWDRQSTIKEWHLAAINRRIWQKKLPRCASTVPELETDSLFIEEVPELARKFHPGADRCFRKRIDGSSAIQCCYCTEGLLITEGSGAGTPDQYAAARVNIKNIGSDGKSAFEGPEHLERAQRNRQYMRYNLDPSTPRVERFMSDKIFPYANSFFGATHDIVSSARHIRTDVKDFKVIRTIVLENSGLQKKYGEGNADAAAAKIYHALGWAPTSP